MPTTDTEKQTLAAVEKTLNIIEMLWKLDGAGVTELATQLNVPKSTVLYLRKMFYVINGLPRHTRC